MKKLFAIILILISTGIAHAELQSFPFLFNGRWQPSEDPLLIDQNGFQDIQNMRKDGKRLRGVNGHTRTTNGVVNATYKFIKNGFHFTKDQPAESHILVWSEDATPTGSKIFQNTTAIPTVGDFSATALHTNASGSDVGQFADAPQGNVLYANGKESMIWGGDEFRTAAFLTSTATVTTTVTNARDYTEQVNNTSTDADDIATVLSASNKVLLIGSTRPLKGIKVTLPSKTGGSSFSTTEYWNGAWTALSNVVDNTSGLNVDGTITWDSTVSDAKTLYLEGFILYWYQFELDSSGATISNITVDAPWQDIKNIWDGSEEAVGSLQIYDGTTYNTYTDEINSDSPEFVAVLDNFSSASHKLYAGFANPQQAISFRMKATKENGNVSVMTVKYWNGIAWTTASSMVDGTAEGGATFAKTGVVRWEQISPGNEFKKAVVDNVPLYYYEISVSANLDDEVETYYATGLYNPQPVKGYRFPGNFQGRSFLFSEREGEQNKAIYSGFNAPDVWGGLDVGELFFGDDKQLTCSGVIYNIFKTTGLDQMIVTKKHETYRVFGFGPDNWEVQRMSSNVGCVAPRSIAVAEISDFGTNSEPSRHVMLWQSDNGVVLVDGASVQLISEDIRIYFDETNSLAIPADMIAASVGWYESNLNVYKLLIASGSGQTTLNVELEFNLRTNEWTKILRENESGENQYQAGWEVHDTDGNTYSYGATSEGHVYRTENGTTWNGTAIEQFVQTKDLLLDAGGDPSAKPFFRDTVAEYIRLAFETKDGTDLSFLIDESGNNVIDEGGDKIITALGENIEIMHYCNRILTVDGVDGQDVPSSFDPNNGPIEGADIVLGKCLFHSFKIKSDITTLTDGMELTGLGLYFEPQETFSFE